MPYSACMQINATQCNAMNEHEHASFFACMQKHKATNANAHMHERTRTHTHGPVGTEYAVETEDQTARQEEGTGHLSLRDALLRCIWLVSAPVRGGRAPRKELPDGGENQHRGELSGDENGGQ